MKQLVSLLTITVLLIQGCNPEKEIDVSTVSSPDQKVEIAFRLNASGAPTYSVSFNNKTVIKPSSMGFDFKGQPSLGSEMNVVNVENTSFSETWEMQWGEQRTVENNYNQMTVTLEEKSESKRKLLIHFKAYNDGIGFRYEFPEHEGVDSLIIMDEHTGFNLTGDHTAWWIPGDWDIYEMES